MKEQIKRKLAEHATVIERIGDEDIVKIEKAAQMIVDCYKKGGKVVLFGNGGSAADAQHIAAELVGKYKLERKALPAIALNINTSIITAIGNDYGFEKVFSRQVEALVNENDVVIALSTSGNSENVIAGVLRAKDRGAKVVALTGSSGGRLKESADILLNVPSDDTPRIQEAHITIGHIICGLVENSFFAL
jgi:D-sedoheptulose 7-phosphate isomerase